MLAMLVVATAMVRFSCVNSIASNEDQFDPEHFAKVFSEDDMTPDFTEQLGSHDHTRDIKKRNGGANKNKYGPTHFEDSTISINNTSKPDVDVGEKQHHNIPHEEIVDVVEREDHATQYLSDQLVNTDSEITSIQGSELEDDRDSLEVKEDLFFTFLTGQQEASEVDGVWWRPFDDNLDRNDEYLSDNVITDMEYND